MNSLKEQFLGFYNTPALFDNILDIKQFNFEDIDLNKFNNDDLVVREKVRLGVRVEYFFEYYLKLTLRYNIIYKNIQIIKDKNTIGEIDFILFDKHENKYLHVELVYKYYLYDPSFDSEIDRYIGPNRDDTLLKRLTKLRDKQFPLLFNDYTKKYLDNIDFENIEQKSCFKTNLYFPLDFTSKKAPIFDNCKIRGFYINHEQFKSQNAFRSFIYKLPDKHDWVCNEKNNKEWISHEEIIEQIDFLLCLKKSPLVWMKDKETTKSFFVTWW